VFKVQDETTESALCVGIISALIWGIGLSLYGFQNNLGQLSWTTWSTQLVGGILACLIVPLVYVRGREWVLARIQAQPRELHQSR
jgi:membrane protein DedA with SNARE-associated domain